MFVTLQQGEFYILKCLQWILPTRKQVTIFDLRTLKYSSKVTGYIYRVSFPWDLLCPQTTFGNYPEAQDTVSLMLELKMLWLDHYILN